MHLKGRIVTRYSRVIEGNLKILESHEGIKLLVKYKRNTQSNRKIWPWSKE